MVIYTDILFLVNLYVDYFILLSVKKFLHLRTTTTRLLLGSVVGAIFSLLPLFIKNNAINYVLAFVFGIVLCLLTFYNGNYRVIIKTYFCFLFLSFAFCGVVFLLSFFSTNAQIIGGKPYFQISPIMLFLFTVISYLVSEIYRHFKGGTQSNLDFYKIIVKDKGKQYDLLAKVDTGNSLIEPFSGLPVMVVEKSCLDFAYENEPHRLIPFNTLGGNGLLVSFKPDEIYIKKTHKELNGYIALFDGSLSNGSYNCIINPQILN